MDRNPKLDEALAYWATRPLDERAWQRAGEAGEKAMLEVLRRGLARYLKPGADARLHLAFLLGAAGTLGDVARICCRDTDDARFVAERYLTAYVRSGVRGLPEDEDGYRRPVEMDGTPMREAGQMPARPNA